MIGSRRAYLVALAFLAALPVAEAQKVRKDAPAEPVAAPPSITITPAAYAEFIPEPATVAFPEPAPLVGSTRRAWKWIAVVPLAAGAIFLIARHGHGEAVAEPVSTVPEPHTVEFFVMGAVIIGAYFAFRRAR